MSLRHSTVLGLVLAACSACKDPDAGVFQGNGNVETKPDRSGLPINVINSLNGTPEAATPAASVTYLLQVTSNSGAQLCNGETQVQIMSDFSIQVPAGRVQCVSLSVDLAGLLGSGATLGGAASSQDNNLSHDGMVLSIKTLAGATFNPPRPFLLGPIVQDASKYQGYTKTTEHDLTAKDPSTGQTVAGHGTFKVDVLDASTTYTNKYIGAGFDKVLHWQIAASGFDQVPAKYGLVFQKMEWFWNVRPIMIPKISIVGHLGDFITGDGTTADALLGQLTIDLIVKAYNTDG